MASRVKFAGHERVFQGDSEDKKGDPLIIPLIIRYYGCHGEALSEGFRMPGGWGGGV